MWRYDGQDSPVVPTTGRRVVTTMRHVLEAPDIPPEVESDRSNDDLTQFEVVGSSLWSSPSHRNRLFVTGAGGSSFKNNPLPSDQFALGTPFRLGAFDIGERRGDNYFAISGGYLREVGRLPDFLGGSIFGGAWLENGSAFDARDVELSTHLGIGLIVETAIGPALAGTSIGFDGQLSRLFRDRPAVSVRLRLELDLET